RDACRCILHRHEPDGPRSDPSDYCPRLWYCRRPGHGNRRPTTPWMKPEATAVERRGARHPRTAFYAWDLARIKPALHLDEDLAGAPPLKRTSRCCWSEILLD